jgi:tetratricopeptide (TPR) repeat protein
LGLGQPPAGQCDEQLFFEDMLAHNPNSFSAAVGLGNLAYQAQDFNSAQGWHSKALELRPYDIVAISNQAATFYQMRRYEDILAMKGLLEIPKVKNKMEFNSIPLASFYTSLGSSAVALKEMDFALDYLCKARRLVPQNSNYNRNAQIIEGLTQKTCP